MTQWRAASGVRRTALRDMEAMGIQRAPERRHEGNDQQQSANNDDGKLKRVLFHQQMHRGLFERVQDGNEARSCRPDDWTHPPRRAIRQKAKGLSFAASTALLVAMNLRLLQTRGLSLERLQSFCRVADAGSLTRAAEGDAGKVSQLSKHLSELEEFFGVDLTRRNGRGVQLTEAGRELLHIAREEFRALEEFRIKCASEPATVHITAGNSVIHWVLAPRLAELSARLPGVGFELHALRTFERIPAVRDHESDFAIVRREVITPPLKSAPAFAMKHRLVLHRDLLKKAGTGDTAELLAKLPLVLPPSGDFRAVLDQAAARHQVRLNVVLSVTAFSIAARAVLTGRFAAILPHVATMDFAGDDYVILPAPLLGSYSQRLSLCWNPRIARMSKAAAEARPVLQEILTTGALVE